MTSTQRQFIGPTGSRRAFLAGSVGLGLALAGCSSNEGGGASDGALSVMLPLFGTAPSAKGKAQKALEKFIGRRLNVTWVPAADYPDKVTVTLASDKLPQIMTMLKKDATFVRSAQAGAFWDLIDKLRKYPNLVGDAKITQAASINGSQYGIFRWRDPMRATALFRADWLDKLGLDVPESVDDLRTVAEAFVKERPGGQKNAGLLLSEWGGTYGLDSPYEFLETWFGAPNGWGERGGKLVPAFDTEEFFEAQRFLRSMRQDGLLNADFATLATVDLDKRFFTGKGGITVVTDDAALTYSTAFDNKDPGKGASYIANAGNLVGPDGARHSFPTPGYSGFLAISRQSVRTEQELDDVLRILNKLNSTKGQELLSLGVEGTNYEMDGEYYVPIKGAEVGANGTYSPLNQLVAACKGLTVPMIKPSSPGFKKLSARRDELRERDLKTAVHNAAAGLVSKTEIAQGAVLNQIIGDARVKFIAGEIDEKGYRAEIKRWHTAGGDKIVSEINDLSQKQ
ncbi:extracellular solute-binding protein [Streptomyces bingchenggensis BCW-1]|uniref:Extracellular solute-binding protein n=1 Tax=Streptomyces bingchenggensis (strain BCW-1) TaxID=749414 RepID=D7BW39_STRBB|nr:MULTISPECIES: extracellular solute-binding protein [Streptomyces]ADI11749.1 extracellular solute-binding protein [Streptomyces bingchenggensis BCW-1]